MAEATGSECFRSGYGSCSQMISVDPKRAAARPGRGGGPRRGGGEAVTIGADLELTERQSARGCWSRLNMPGTPTLAANSRSSRHPRDAVRGADNGGGTGFARPALSAGAPGYVLKDAAEAELIEAVGARWLAGGTYLDPSLGARAGADGARARRGTPGPVPRRAEPRRRDGLRRTSTRRLRRPGGDGRRLPRDTSPSNGRWR